MEFTKENWENAPEGATLEWRAATPGWEPVYFVGWDDGRCRQLMPAFFIAWEHARVANEVLKRVVLGYLDTGE